MKKRHVVICAVVPILEHQQRVQGLEILLEKMFFVSAVEFFASPCMCVASKNMVCGGNCGRVSLCQLFMFSSDIIKKQLQGEAFFRYCLTIGNPSLEEICN